MKENYIFAAAFSEWVISSAGSEHLVYTEGVGSSNLSSPTHKKPSDLEGFLYLQYFTEPLLPEGQPTQITPYASAGLVAPQKYL